MLSPAFPPRHTVHAAFTANGVPSSVNTCHKIIHYIVHLFVFTLHRLASCHNAKVVQFLHLFIVQVKQLSVSVYLFRLSGVDERILRVAFINQNPSIVAG